MELYILVQGAIMVWIYGSHEEEEGLEEGCAAQFRKAEGLIASTTIGIKVWLVPQISEHWP